MAIDWSVIGTALAGVVGGVGIWFQTRKVTRARFESESSEYNADTAASKAERTMYEQLRKRLDDCEKDITNLRNELNDERRRGRDLELHIWKLEKLMKDAGLEVPMFVFNSMVSGRD